MRFVCTCIWTAFRVNQFNAGHHGFALGEEETRGLVDG
jgi:hypothetical protein